MSNKNRTRRSPKKKASQESHFVTQVRATIARSRAARLGASDMRSAIDGFRIGLRYNEVPNAVRSLGNHRVYASIVWPCPFPVKWEAFSDEGSGAYLTFFKEIEWASCAIAIYSQQINEFLKLKHDFDKALLSGDVERARNVLAEVEEKQGLSLWLAESNIALLQHSGGFKAQKDYSKTVRSKISSTLGKYLLAWISLKYEENTSYAQMTRLIDRFASKDSGLYYLVRIILGDFVTLNREMAAQAISHAETLPVIDRYESFVRICHAVLASNPNDSEVKIALRNALCRIAESVEDLRLSRTCFILGGDFLPSRVRGSLASLLEEYTRGKYSQAVELSESESSAHPDSIVTIDVWRRAKSAAGKMEIGDSHGGAPSLRNEIKECLSEIIELGPKAVERRQRLQKIGIVHSSTRWSAALQLLVPPEQDLSNSVLGEQRGCYLALQSHEEHPLLVGHLTSLIDVEDYLLKSTPAEASETARLMLYTYGYNLPSKRDFDALPLPTARCNRYRAVSLVRHGKLAEALPLLNSTYQEAETAIDRMEAGTLLVVTLMSNNELGAAAGIAATLLLQSAYYSSVLPLAKLVFAIAIAQEEGDDQSALANLSIATIADMYARYIAPDYETVRSDAYKDFLRANGVKRPSELKLMLGEFPLEEINYFLRYVCVPEVMDQSLALRSTTEVEDERAAVLRLLTEMTPEAERETQLAFLEELREIRTRQVVRETNKRLEQSKIFVNIEGIKKRIDTSIRDSWDRYKLLSLESDSNDFFTEVRRIIEKTSGGKLTTLHLSMPETEKDKLFYQMVLEIRDLFVESKEFGLDANLSANIRHGYILREIRSPLLTQNLITNRPSLDLPHEVNLFWSSRLQGLAQWEHTLLQAALSKFSSDVDAKIEDLNTRILRIHSQANPEGMFHYSVSGPQLSLLQRKSETIEKHDDFLQFILDYFWKETDYNLGRARQYLTEVVLQDFSDILDGLDRSLEQVANSSKLTALRSAIALARPELQAAIGRVSSWFTLSTDVDFPDYAAETAYQAGIETIKTYAGNVQIVSRLTCDNAIELRGRTLPFIGRIIFIILDNIVEHSQISSGEIGVKCAIQSNDGFLIFRIISDLGPDVDLQVVKRRADEVNEQYGTEKASQFISVERRSGYPKIWKILTHDLQVQHVLKVSVDTDRREFCVEIKMAASSLMA